MKVKGIKITIILSLLASVLMPFSVYADTISQSDIQGVERVLVNSTYLDQTVTNAGNTYKYYSFDYEVTVLLKDYYLGWIQGVFQTSFKTFDNANWQVQNSSCTTVSKSYYVNDNKLKSSFTITAWVLVNQQGNVDPAGSYTTSFTLSNSNIVAYQDLNSIDTVIDLLQDINQYVSIDILNELQNIVANTNLSNTYLETISKLRQYNFPIESFSLIWMDFQAFDIFTTVNYGYWEYPIFKVNNNNSMFYYWFDDRFSYSLIFATNNNIYDVSTFNSNLNLTDFQNVSNLTVKTLFNLSSSFNVVKVDFNVTTSSNMRIRFNSNNLLFVPIYLGRSDNKYLSTDFALRFGLSNQLLDDLHIIANGNNNYDQSKNDLDDDTSDFVTDSGNLIQIEENYLDDLDTSLQSIDTNTGLNIFGGNFLTSATWVRTQFDRLTYNNPFGSLIVYGMTLGLALLLLGKVML